MARGWESKSVEQQMEDRQELSSAVPHGGNAHPHAAEERAWQLLELSRKQLVCELEGIVNPRLREIKRRALAHVEERLRQVPR